ncbi:hypothetical protein I5H03_gp046 [Mycobacterium phage Nibb]|uniref:Uncharacterized protein n=1 Tax=Mycobacterium phage Nibb TaxID=2510585 RepID=A0A411B5I2_9CAUD|nr:hypothetical protein I5H03_gp046 [Mycobacterium phage Nibb]QAX95600.1 hypothetical protein SEA_NIBB_61 [Mycobacterium phage Nibb]
MSNFAQVGTVIVPTAGSSIGKPRFAAVEPVEVLVGVRADLGEVVVQVDGNKGALPPLVPEKAAQLGVLLGNGAAMAAELAEAYRSYQAALQAAEDKLAAAMKGGVQ